MRAASLVAFVGGVCLLQVQATLPSPALAVALLLSGAAAGALALRNRDRIPAAAAYCGVVTAACAAGFCYAAAASALRLADALPAADEGRDLVVEGVVASLPTRLERGLRFEFDVEQTLSPDAQVPRRVLLGWHDIAARARPGERWQFTVRLKRPHGVLNPGGFDLEAWLLERNLRATGSVRTSSTTAAPRRIEALVERPRYLIERGRDELRQQLEPRLAGQRYGGVLLALILGDQHAIAAPDWSLFNRTGVSHLVSISGLHITMIASLAGWLVASAWRRSAVLLRQVPAQTAGVICGLAAAVGYALLAGWGIPAQRTVLMLAIVAAAWLVRTRVGFAESLALAAALVCLVDPWAVLAAGFWLSFGAVGAIVWVVHGRERRAVGSAWRHALATAARVQIAVTLALLPATVFIFHQMSLVSPLANAVAIPVVSWLVTPLALIAGVLVVLPAPLGAGADWLLNAAHAGFALLAALLQWGALLPAAAWAAATPPWPVVALGAAGVAWLLAPPGWPVRGLGAAVLLPLIIWPAERPAVGELWVTALDVGQGSAVLVETSDRAWLYDAGPRYSAEADAGERIVLPYLRHRGLRALDGLIVSHLDNDHAGGAAAVLRGVEVRRLISSIDYGSPVLAGRARERCEAGAQWSDGALRFTLLHPAAEDYKRRRSTNAMSCAVLVESADRRLLLTGDIGLAEEAAIVARWPQLRADWLAAPHHGSKSSSGSVLLAQLQASEAVAQAGYRNRYGHPDPAVAARYRALGIHLWRTDQAGALQWRFGDDGRVAFSAWRTAGVRYWHDRPAVPATEQDAGDDAEEPAYDGPFIAG